MKVRLPVGGFLLLLTLLTFWGQQARASHAMAADLSIRCTGGNTYEVTLSFYRDCDGIRPPSAYTVDVNSTSCSVNTTLSTILQPNFPQEVSPLCPSQVNSSTCNGGTLTGIQEWVYRGTITLPMACPDWVFSFREFARNAAVTTLFNPGLQFIYLETILDNAQAPCNNSPYFTSRPVPFFCLGQPFSYNHGAVDPDGDSLVYSFIDALDDAGNPVVYNPGFSGTNPMSSNPLVSIDPNNGNINITPTALEIGVIAVQVEEYRNGVLIGSTIRDIQVTVINCTNIPPSTSFPQNISGGVSLSPTTIETCPGQLLSFDIVSTDSNSLDSVLLSWNQSIPGATFTITGQNPATATFNWIPQGSDAGVNTMLVFTNDNGCPVLIRQSVGIEIIVLDGTTGGPDQGYCPAGVVPVLNATGGSSFTWTVLSGDPGSLSCTNCAQPTASPSVTSVYEVVGNLPLGCRLRDTVTVNVAPDFSLAMSGNVTICEGGAAQISAFPDVPDTYTYNWTPVSGLSNSASGSPMAGPSSATTYVAQVTSSQGCTQIDSLTVTIGPRLSVLAAATPTAVCQGDIVSLSSALNASPVECGPGTTPCSSPSTVTIGTGNGIVIRPTPFYGFYEDSRVQYLFLASELNAMGFTGGTLDGLGFDVATKRSSQPYNGYNLRVGCTNLTEMLSFQTGLTTVFSGNLTTTTGWNMFTFTTPYEWDGVSNLIIEMCFDNSSYTLEDRVRFTPTTFTSVAYDFTDGATGCLLAFPAISNLRANTRFSFCNASAPASLSYAWSPSGGMTSPTLPSTNVTTSDNATYTIEVTDLNSGCVTEDQVSLEVATADAGPDQVICEGDTTVLNALYLGPDNTSVPLSCGLNPGGCTGVNRDITVGNDVLVGALTPFKGTDEDARMQFLITAAELNAAGLSGGTLNSIAFDVTQKNSTQAYSSFTVQMGCSNLTSLSGFVAGLSNVFNNSVTTTTGWNTLTLDTPYDWDGTSNLIIQVCYNNNSETDDDLVRYTPTSFISLVYASADNGNGCTLSSQGTSTQRPNIRLGTCQIDAPVYTWSPASMVSDASAISPSAFPPVSQYMYVEIDNGDCVVRDSIYVTVGCLLPVELSKFQGTRKDSRSHLWWHTSSEVNSEFFIVEREKEGSFVEIGRLQAAGTSTSRRDYNFYDENPNPGYNRYRLRVQDFDGLTELSNIVEISFASRHGLEVLSVFPNPGNGRFTFDLNFLESREAQLFIFDAQGKMIRRFPISGEGKFSEEVDLSSLTNGLYFFELRSGVQRGSRGKLIKI